MFHIDEDEMSAYKLAQRLSNVKVYVLLRTQITHLDTYQDRDKLQENVWLKTHPVVLGVYTTKPEIPDDRDFEYEVIECYLQ